MNSEQAKKLEGNKIWEAFKEGKQIQRNISVSQGSENWRDVKSLGASFADNPDRYRVKPEIPIYMQEGWIDREPGEIIESGDWTENLGGSWREVCGAVGIPVIAGGLRIRTNKPKKLNLSNPPVGEEWHNPLNLSAGQVGLNDGYRLLLKSEMPPCFHSNVKGKVEIYNFDDQQWWRCCGGDSEFLIYRTKEPLPVSNKIRVKQLEKENNILSSDLHKKHLEWCEAMQEIENLKKRIKLVLDFPYEKD